MVVTGLPGHQAGEALPATMDEVQPLVLAEGTMGVEAGGDGEQLGHGGDVALAHLALDLESVH